MQPLSFFSPFGSAVEALWVPAAGAADVEAPGWAAGAWASGVGVGALGLAVVGVDPCGSVAGVVCAMAVATKKTNAVTIDNDSFFIFFSSPESKIM